MKRVVKVGGSLLSFEELPAELRRWVAAQAPGVNLLLAGGGELAETIRAADRRFELGDEQAHWLAISVLGTTARLLAALLGDPARVVDRLEELKKATCHDALLCVDPRRFLELEEPHLAGEKLPHTWQVTSDSIAARLAQAVQADELVLLKSQLPPPGTRRMAAASSGYVDAFFPGAAEQVPRVRCVNLRDPQHPEFLLRPHG